MGTGDPVASWIGDGPALCPQSSSPVQKPQAQAGAFSLATRDGELRDLDFLIAMAVASALTAPLNSRAWTWLTSSGETRRRLTAVRRDAPQAYS
jgi:hypothetical protein